MLVSGLAALSINQKQAAFPDLRDKPRQSGSTETLEYYSVYMRVVPVAYVDVESCGKTV